MSGSIFKYILLLILFLYKGSAYGFDFKKDSCIWTFDKGIINSIDENIYNIDGIYYYGDLNYTLIDTLKSQVEGLFSDGSKWQTKRKLMLQPSNIPSDFLMDIRKIAGKKYGNTSNTLSFNIFSPGTCRVIVGPSDNMSTSGKVMLHSQFKGKDGKWNEMIESKDITDNDYYELSLHGEAQGSFWISSDLPVSIYAISFSPDEDFKIYKTQQDPIIKKEKPNGNIFYDFGKAAFGQIELTLSSINGNDTVSIHLGECSIDETVNRKPGGSRTYKRLDIPLEKGTHTYRPEINWKIYSDGLKAIYMPMEIGDVMPFRYCEIECSSCNVECNEIHRYVVNSEFNEDNSFFHCDNQNLNSVWDLCKYTMKATSFIGYYVDGDRERCPYEADALINQLSHFACDSNYSISKRTIEYLLLNPTWPTEWIMQTVLMAWNDFLFSGDDYIISNYTDLLYNHTLKVFVDPKNGFVSTTALEQTVDKLSSINRTNILRDIVDWPHSDEDPTFAPQGGEDDGFIYSDYNTVVNAYHYKACLTMAEIYKALNKQEEEREMLEYCIKFKEKFNQSFFDKNIGLYQDGIGINHYSLHSNMFALCFDLVPEEYKVSVSEYLVKKGLACSVYGAQFLLEALFKCNMANEAIELLANDTQRSWMNMIYEGSTITTEAWSNSIKPNQDWTHAWGASPANLIQFSLLGIKPTSPSFNSVQIKPQIGYLNEVTAKCPTKHGSIELRIKKEEDGTSLEFIIPEEIDADILLSKSDYDFNEVYFDDNLVLENEEDKDFIKISSISGSHRIDLIKQTNKAYETFKYELPTEEIYDILGRKLSGNRKKGIYIINNKKIIK